MTNDDELDIWRTRTIRFRQYGPMTAGDPVIGNACPACSVPFAVGDYGTLIPLGPGARASARAEAHMGRGFCAAAIPVHWACATGEEP